MKRAMFPPFHICKVQSDGSRRWMKAATNLEDAKALVKVLAASSPGEYVITNLTGDKTSLKFPPKRIMFQIGYDEKELNARAELFRRCGQEVISVVDNETAKHALDLIESVDVFVVGYKAPEQTRKEMVDLAQSEFSKGKDCCPDSVCQSSVTACRLQYRVERLGRVAVPSSGHRELISRPISKV